MNGKRYHNLKRKQAKKNSIPFIRDQFMAPPISITHILMLTSAVRDRHQVLPPIAEYYLHHSSLQETEDSRNIRNLGKADSRTCHNPRVYIRRSTMVSHGAEPGELLLTMISSNTELDDHKIVCECLFCV